MVSASGSGLFRLSNTVSTVGTAITIRTRAGAMVQPISKGVFPWICSGSGSPGLRLKRMVMYIRMPPTTTKTKTAAQNIQKNRLSWDCATGPETPKVDCGLSG